MVICILVFLAIIQTLLSRCTYTQHARCAARIIDHFEWTDRERCPIACASEQFHRTAIEVGVDYFTLSNFYFHTNVHTMKILTLYQ